MNPVAHQAVVIATGARPGEIGGQRELFTEETSTVLVFENGGVLRLSAAVAAGQLLFLTNKETQREVVAQVKGKRDFRPTSCYVEVEFSEPSPGFWGIEFPETPDPAPASAQQTEAAEMVRTARAIVGETKAPAAAPSAQDVATLKQEVEALRAQLKLLRTETPAVDSPAPQAIPVPPRAPAAAEARREEKPKLPRESAKTSAAGSVKVAQKLAGLPVGPAAAPFFAEEPPPKPVIRVSRPKPVSTPGAKPLGRRGRRARRAAARRIGLTIAALLLVIGGPAWYRTKHLRQPKPVSANASANSATPPAPLASSAPASGTSTSAPSAPAAGATAFPRTTVATTSLRATPSGASGAMSSSTLAAPAQASRADVAVNAVSSPDKSTVVSVGAKGAVPRGSSEGAVASTVGSSHGAGIVPPRLIKSVRAVASPSVLQYFEAANTATVTLDAIVDTSGHVSTMRVLAGPGSLRGAAMNALKQYRYAPARLKGKPVAAHVTVKVEFLFEK